MRESIPRWAYWREALKWLVWVCTLGLAPIWISLLLLSYFGEVKHLSSLFDQGQLSLYATAMAGTALYLSALDREPPGMRFRSLIMLISWVVTVVAVTTYVAVQTLGVIDQPEFELDGNVVITTSVIIYVFALIAAFLATLIDNERLEQRFSNIQQDHKSQLRDEFQGLE